MYSITIIIIIIIIKIIIIIGPRRPLLGRKGEGGEQRPANVLFLFFAA